MTTEFEEPLSTEEEIAAHRHRALQEARGRFDSLDEDARQRLQALHDLLMEVAAGTGCREGESGEEYRLRRVGDFGALQATAARALEAFGLIDATTFVFNMGRRPR